MYQIIPVVICVFVIIAMIRCMRIAVETQRFVVFRLGQFLGLRGPGLFFLAPSVDKAYSLSVGQKGELMIESTARFDGVDVPVIRDLNAAIGCVVQITGFDQDKVVIARSADQSRFVYCEKCGHQMRV